MSINLDLGTPEKVEKYKIKAGIEIFELDYPSYKQSKEISESFKDVDNVEAADLMVDWLKKLGMPDKILELPQLKSHHLAKIWQELNTVKK